MTDGPHSEPTAVEIARAVAARSCTAVASVEAALQRIRSGNGRVNAFTDVLDGRAMARARALDARLATGEDVGPLAGVPFAVKNLIDLAGVTTRAGAGINEDDPPAARDATLVRRLEAAGAVCVGALNMGEYAYDFTGENIHAGPSRNPHDPDRMTGGSSGGSGAAVAAGLVPLALGSDTNGSIRVPSAFCGLYGLKPTYGRLSRAGTFPFVASLDHLGPMARCVGDLAVAYDAMQGPDAADGHLADRPVEPALPALEGGMGGLRIAVADGYFEAMAGEDARAAARLAASLLGATDRVTIPDAAPARAAAYVVTAAEGAALHLDRLRSRGRDFDPAVRDRLIAGAMIPASWVDRAQRFRRRYRTGVLALFDRVDVILAPSTPCRAPRIGQATIMLDGREVPARASIGVLTQPISFIGLPVVAVPIRIDGGLPLGVQLIAAPWREADALRAAMALEEAMSTA